MRIHKPLIALLTTTICHGALAASITTTVYRTSKHGHGTSLGTVTFEDSQYGLLIKPHLTHLSPGIHGLHIHTKPDCSNMGLAAGGHFDPQHTGHHFGPYNPHGHLGDLPALTVNQQGQATLPTLAPRLSVSQIKGHSLIIHAGGDTYSDHPTLGGGGKRIACGVIAVN